MLSWASITACLVIAVAACHPVNTVPEPVSPAAAVQYFDLDVPHDLEIRAVDFSATTFTDVSGSQGLTSSAVGGEPS